MVYILILIAGLFLTLGDVFMQKWIDTNSYWYYFIGMVIYVLALGGLAFSFKYKSIVIASILYILVNIISLILVNQLFFGKSMTISEYIGIGFALISVVFLEYKF